MYCRRHRIRPAPPALPHHPTAPHQNKRSKYRNRKGNENHLHRTQLRRACRGARPHAGAADAPQFFLKPDTALLRNNDPFYVPDFSREVHYETELVVKINRVGRAIGERFAPRYYSEVGLGIDFTARDLQRTCIAKGLPWEIAKAFDHSAGALPQLHSTGRTGGNVQNLHFEMKLNGETRQLGFTGDMLFPVDRIIAYVSRFITLKMGDLNLHRDASRRRAGPAGDGSPLARGIYAARFRHSLKIGT